MDRLFQILSLDGGGIKGVFSAAILANIETDLNVKITDHFDLIVGTSTGGIITLGLSVGYSPREILEFYVSNHLQIFNKGLITNLRHYFQNKYSPQALEKSLKKYFGDKRLSDCCKKIVVPSYNMSDDDVYIFKTPHHKRLKRDYKIPLWKVGMATSAAPTYFPTFNEIDNIRLIDGGVWANNPTMVGIIEALSLFNVDISSIKVFSLGTTNELKSRPANLNSGGLWQWKKDASNVLMHSQSIAINNIASHIIGKDNILRIDPSVPEGLFKLDKLNIDELIAKASSCSRKQIPEVESKFLSHMAERYEPLYK